MVQNQTSSFSDKAGIGSAVLCTIHCLIVPVFFLIKYSVLSGNSGINLPQWWEKLDYFFLVVSFLAVYHSASHTRSTEIKISLWIFWGILAVAIIFESALHNLAYLASAGLVVTHFINIKRMRKYGHTHKPIEVSGLS
jgi:hypothetical protein